MGEERSRFVGTEGRMEYRRGEVTTWIFCGVLRGGEVPPVRTACTYDWNDCLVCGTQGGVAATRGVAGFDVTMSAGRCIGDE